ncbi:736_t:CDS:1, partial [Entrophospora sp. SA101]
CIDASLVVKFRDSAMRRLKIVDARIVEHDGGWIEHLLHEAENERQAIH